VVINVRNTLDSVSFHLPTTVVVLDRTHRCEILFLVLLECADDIIRRGAIRELGENNLRLSLITLGDVVHRLHEYLAATCGIGFLSVFQTNHLGSRRNVRSRHYLSDLVYEFTSDPIFSLKVISVT